jgi:antitoxin component YwqK of YwqJK toxin-antitoxin module
MLRRTMSNSLAALAVSILALDSCSSKPQEAQLKDIKNQDEKMTLHGAPYTGIILDQHKNGRPRLRWEVRNGLHHGVAKEWWENGQQSTETHFDNGKRHGLNRYWTKEGQLMKEQMYDQDHSLSEKLWPQGKPASVQ